MNCASCHACGKNYAKAKKTLRKGALEKYGVGLEQPQIQEWLANSRQHKTLILFKMEGGKLTVDQWGDVTTYVADQSSGEKWPDP